MAVNLSPIGGVAAQFFDNSGNVLSGGKIFTYAAGTTTPLAAYTSSNGATAHANPIILDAAGRVPTGEIWLTDGLQYKFIIKTSTDVQIGSYDNIIGINSNFVNYTNSQEFQTATAGQTVFTLTTMAYQPATNSLSVFVDGVNQYGPGALYAYQETSATVVTFTSGLHVGAEVKFTTSAINASSYGDASQISYAPPFTGGVATNVEDKLAQSVSVKDFGAVGDGINNDTAAIQAALNTQKTAVLFPAGNYRTTSSITPTNGQTLIFDGAALVIDAAVTVLNVSANNVTLINPVIKTPVSGTYGGFYGIYITGDYARIVDCSIYDIEYNAVLIDGSFARIEGLSTYNCGWDSIVFYNNSSDNFVTNLFSYRSGRSAVGSDVGSIRNVVDGVVVIDNGSPLVLGQHHDCLHFEGAIASVFRNASIYYTVNHPAHSTGLVDVNAALRFNAAVGCVAENIQVIYDTSCNNTLVFSACDGDPEDVLMSDVSVINNTSYPMNLYVDIQAALPGVFNIDGLVVSGPFTITDQSNANIARNFTNCTFSNLYASAPANTTPLYTNAARTNNLHFRNCVFDNTNSLFDAAGWQYSSITNCTIKNVNGFVLKTYAFNFDATYRPKNGVVSNNMFGDVTTVFDFFQGQGPCAVVNNVFTGAVTTMVLSNGGVGGVGGSDSRWQYNMVTGTVTNMNASLNSDANQP